MTMEEEDCGRDCIKQRERERERERGMSWLTCSKNVVLFQAIIKRFGRWKMDITVIPERAFDVIILLRNT